MEAELSAMTIPLPEEMLATTCIAAGITLATAESCTGGYLAHRITSIPGSSAYFLGGVVSYSNALKQQLLDVPAEILERFGAVSAPCAEAMAKGIQARTGATLGLATTGIAGPGGATPTKPVGLVYIACATPQAVVVEQQLFSGDRLAVIVQAASAALALALRCAHELAHGTSSSND